MSVFPSVLTRHGGRLDEAARRFPGATLPWLDLSTGINPVPYRVDAARYADPAALPSPSALADLEAAAAKAFGMSPRCAIAALPGSEIGLRLLSTLGLPAPMRIVRPTYATHAAALPQAEAVAIDALLTKRAAGRTILLANPNNPDGRLVAPAALLALGRALGDDGWLVIDEAFADASDGASILPLLTADDRILVLRSFGKFYGLAGLRLGFACGHAGLVDRLRDLVGDWPVSSAAIAVGLAAYGDTAWQAITRARLATAAAALDDVLRRHGLKPQGTSPLFRLVEVPDAAAVFERLAQQGILVRPFDHAATGLRIGLPADATALARLDRALNG